MLQTVAGREVFVVEFDTMPELPITWSTEEERPYAQILGAAIMTGLITEPGKYGLAIEDPTPGSDDLNFTVHAITE